MKTKIIRIGNSKRVYLPKSYLQESGLSEEVELILRDNEIVLRNIHPERENREQNFRKMADSKDNFLMDGEKIPTKSKTYATVFC